MATVLNIAKDFIYVTEKVIYSFRQSTEHLSAVSTKETLYKKIKATNMFFIFFNNNFSSYKNSTNFQEQTIFNRYLKDNDMRFKEILNLVRLVSLKELCSLISLIYKDKLISKRERIKLYIYYFYRRNF